MGADTNKHYKQASIYLLNMLDDGSDQHTYIDLCFVARMKFGYSDKFVNKFLYELEQKGFITHKDGGFITWNKKTK